MCIAPACSATSQTDRNIFRGRRCNCPACTGTGERFHLSSRLANSVKMAGDFSPASRAISPNGTGWNGGWRRSFKWRAFSRNQSRWPPRRRCFCRQLAKAWAGRWANCGASNARLTCCIGWRAGRPRHWMGRSSKMPVAIARLSAALACRDGSGPAAGPIG